MKIWLNKAKIFLGLSKIDFNIRIKKRGIFLLLNEAREIKTCFYFRASDDNKEAVPIYFQTEIKLNSALK